MHCVDGFSFVFSLVWSGAMVTLVEWIDYKNGFISGLKDLASLPIVSSLMIAAVYVYLTYSPAKANDNQTLGELAKRSANFLDYVSCSFIHVLNIWGALLLVVAIVKCADRWFPDRIKQLKESFRSLFGL
tara:strand:- start:1108 stop:1497 length:390 start_codon:yes stop_codon:yes gene_type:complete